MSKAKRISRSVCSSPRVGLKKSAFFSLRISRPKEKDLFMRGMWGLLLPLTANASKAESWGDNTYDYERQVQLLS